ncbi:MAG: DUF3137 domain-containing protein [Victivallales bacterium]|nr:DUF3137 domain-containing protein [Victivallales bacterium]
MKSPEELRAFFHSDLKGTLEELEGIRRGLCRKMLTIGAVCGILALVGTALGFFLGPIGMVASFIACAVLAVICYFTCLHSDLKKFKHEFKHRVIGGIVKFIDPSLEYAPTGFIPQGTYMQSTLFNKQPDRYRGEDLVRGRIDNTNIEFSEVHSEYKTQTTDSKGRRQTQWHTIFKGLFLVADFNRNFHGTTVVLPDLAEKAFGFLGRMLQKLNIARSGQLIQLEDPEFEKLFVVYGSDQIEARYILTTSMMERLALYHRKAKGITGGNIFVAFTGRKIFVALWCLKNLFEPRIFSQNDSFSLVREHFEFMTLATGIVAELKLNPKLVS